jgi:hypothetical protein
MFIFINFFVIDILPQVIEGTPFTGRMIDVDLTVFPGLLPLLLLKPLHGPLDEIPGDPWHYIAREQPEKVIHNNDDEYGTKQLHVAGFNVFVAEQAKLGQFL